MVPQVGFPAEKSKINVRQVENGGSPDVVLPPDSRDIAVGLCPKSSSCFGKQFLAISEDRGFRGADLDTTGFFPLEDPGVAEIAFLNGRLGALPIVSGDPEGTGIHAISAAQTDGEVIYDSPFGGSAQSRHRAGSHAGRVEAVLAVLANVVASGAGDDRGPAHSRKPVQ